MGSLLIPDKAQHQVGGFLAHCVIPGCISEGESREEAIRNIREAIELYLEPVEDDQPVSS